MHPGARNRLIPMQPVSHTPRLKYEREISRLFKPLLFGIFIYSPTLSLPRWGGRTRVRHGPVEGQKMRQGQCEVKHLPCLPLSSSGFCSNGFQDLSPQGCPGQPAASLSPAVIPRSPEAALGGGTGWPGHLREPGQGPPCAWSVLAATLHACLL